ncbi:unnamed protein product (macronuclear) [Paramecium tetraurelia]|uniref:Protein kinase domain-containing protein n=1 Tax=Paramecium tetraurelia TaxID=5888 RepID=A0CAV8_PARTE|nr:uncharacterized protein GSPATT00036706001 [Paramecium tetraurelia]CAK67925.1 unnamed protein product [Paramecium tetraurelia]|eukprot:XP_001435322.1 hypothetical protein (macronuclear) [Paramecium tetraurelia strain d4-2]
MLTILQFPCWILKVQHSLTLFDERIEITKHNLVFKIDIHLKIKMRWEISPSGIQSVHIQDLMIQANQEDLNQLKQHLDGRVSYLGIQNYYETIELLSDKKNCKICKVEDRFTKVKLCCRSLRKDAYNQEQLYQSIIILYKLQQHKYFPKLYEVYESKAHIYIVMELMDHNLNVDLIHEEIQIITLDLLKTIRILIDNNIQYSKFKLSDLMMDKRGNIKLISFCHASRSKDIDLDNYLGNIGQIMIQLYGFKASYTSLPYIPDKGNEFIVGLMNPNLDYRFTFEDAMRHEYIQSIFGETNIPVKFTQNPKLITGVTEAISQYTKSSYYQKIK